MPFGMLESIQAVVIGDNIYVGGGYNNNRRSIGTIVMVYSLNTELWSTLPPYEIEYFGMAAVSNQLVLVGGRKTPASMAVSVLGVWDEQSQTWTHPYPEMLTSRFSHCVASYQNWLTVAGGWDGSNSRLNKVELLDIHSGQWYEGPPLPDAYSGMSSAINGNMWYLSRGYSSKGAPNKHVFSVCLDDLISQAISLSTSESPSTVTPSPWQTLADTPLTNSTVIVFSGALLAVGGWSSSVIHHYQPSSRSWVKVGDLLGRRWDCACTVLPSGEIFVAGGDSRIGMIANRVDIAVHIHT